MAENEKRWRRRSIYENAALPWHIGRVPSEMVIRGKLQNHPARHSAVFVVHGIGEQGQAETAAQLRSGFDDALLKIENWQVRHGKVTLPEDVFMPPPYILDGYWANYSDIQMTFKEEWDKFEDDAPDFFKNLWKKRIFSTSNTYRWFIKQQLRLLHPRVIRDVGFLAWLFYWPFQIISFVTLTTALILNKKLLSSFLEDVRLYLDPKGITERAIVQRIDQRVAEKFMSLLGLDLEFRQLKEKRLEFDGQPLEFTRVVWVAHSLGTVISYNVISDLFHRAEEIKNDGKADPEQKEGVIRFRTVLKRFITLGSPLDKVAYLFKDKSITPWPNIPREKLLISSDPANCEECWVNYYHLLDPVSGSLESPLICHDQKPSNIHIRLGHLPGFAHTAYWKDYLPLRFI
ncbi:MAG: hypothetical protein ACREBV_09060, partial [Candidatus Zixiibacteriota bacterium]